MRKKNIVGQKGMKGNTRIWSRKLDLFFFNPGEQKQTLSTCNLEMQESCLQCWVLQGNSREPSAVLNLG